MDAKQKGYAQEMLTEIHGQFIDAVRKGRGKRLKETPDMFSGLMWSGSRSVQLGLADGFGTVESVARDIVKVETYPRLHCQAELCRAYCQALWGRHGGKRGPRARPYRAALIRRVIGRP